jgi:hypothetical protein
MKHNKRTGNGDNNSGEYSSRFNRLINLAKATDKFIDSYIGTHIFMTHNITIYDHSAFVKVDADKADKLKSAYNANDLNNVMDEAMVQEIMYESNDADDSEEFDQAAVLYKTEASAYFFWGSVSSGENMVDLLNDALKENLSVIIGDLC